MADEITFECAGCKQRFPLRIGSMRMDFMGGKHGEGVVERDAKHAGEFVTAVTEHTCDAKLIQMSNQIATAC